MTNKALNSINLIYSKECKGKSGIPFDVVFPNLVKFNRCRWNPTTSSDLIAVKHSSKKLNLASVERGAYIFRTPIILDYGEVKSIRRKVIFFF